MMKLEDLRQLRKLLKKAGRIKVQISKHRDNLRDVISDLEDIQHNCDESIEYLDDGIREFDRAADELSKYL